MKRIKLVLQNPKGNFLTLDTDSYGLAHRVLMEHAYDKCELTVEATNEDVVMLIKDMGLRER